MVINILPQILSMSLTCVKPIIYLRTEYWILKLCKKVFCLDYIPDSDVFSELQVSSWNGPKEVSSCDKKSKSIFLVAKCNEDQWWMFHSSLRPVWTLSGHRQQDCEGRCEAAGSLMCNPMMLYVQAWHFLTSVFIRYIGTFIYLFFIKSPHQSMSV